MRGCQLCTYREAHGWWGNPKLHHCRDCHRTWTGTAQVHCVRCHHHFSSYSACDRHLVDEMCKPPQEVRDAEGIPKLGLRQDKYGYTWSFAGDGTPWWLATHVLPDSLTIEDEESAGSQGGDIPASDPEGRSSLSS